MRSYFEQYKRKVLILNRLRQKVYRNEFGHIVTMWHMVPWNSWSVIIKYGSFPKHEINRGTASYSLEHLLWYSVLVGELFVLAETLVWASKEKVLMTGQSRSQLRQAGLPKLWSQDQLAGYVRLRPGSGVRFQLLYGRGHLLSCSWTERQAGLQFVTPKLSQWTNTLKCVGLAFPHSEPTDHIQVTCTFKGTKYLVWDYSGCCQPGNEGGGSLEVSLCPVGYLSFLQTLLQFANSWNFISASISSAALSFPFWDHSSFSKSPDTFSDFAQPHPRAYPPTCSKTDAPSSPRHSY